MKQLLYYDLDNKFVSEQVSAGGDGSKVVSVYNGIAWTEDSGVTYYRDNTTQKVTYNVTVHYKNADLGTDICEPDIIQVKSYSGCSATEMLYPKKFDNLIPSITEAYLTVSSNTEYTFFYNVEDFRLVPLTFIITSPGYIQWVRTPSSSSYEMTNKTIEYSKNSENWTSITSESGESAPKIYVSAGDIVQFKGNNDAYSKGWIHNSFDRNTFSASTCGFELCGNIMSLLKYDDFATAMTLDNVGWSGYGTYYAFHSLFTKCTGLTSAKNLVLPATSVTECCYHTMFSDCINLVEGPKELPAQNITDGVYLAMFENCSKLERGPEILAKCSLGGSWPLQSMFYNCSSLNYIKCMITGTISDKDWCQTFNWTHGVAPSGTFVKNSATNWPSGVNGIPEGWTIIDEES